MILPLRYQPSFLGDTGIERWRGCAYREKPEIIPRSVSVFWSGFEVSCSLHTTHLMQHIPVGNTFQVWAFCFPPVPFHHGVQLLHGNIVKWLGRQDATYTFFSACSHWVLCVFCDHSHFDIVINHFCLRKLLLRFELHDLILLFPPVFPAELTYMICPRFAQQ